MRARIATGAGAALAGFLAVAPAPVLAQESKNDIKKDIEGLKQGERIVTKGAVLIKGQEAQGQ